MGCRFFSSELLQFLRLEPERGRGEEEARRQRGWVPKLAPGQGGQGERLKKRGRPCRLGGGWCKQRVGNLPARPVLGPARPGGAPPPASISRVCREALLGVRSESLSTSLAQVCILEKRSDFGNGGWRVHFRNAGGTRSLSFPRVQLRVNRWSRPRADPVQHRALTLQADTGKREKEKREGLFKSLAAH